MSQPDSTKTVVFLQMGHHTGETGLYLYYLPRDLIPYTEHVADLLEDNVPFRLWTAQSAPAAEFNYPTERTRECNDQTMVGDEWMNEI